MILKILWKLECKKGNLAVTQPGNDSRNGKMLDTRDHVVNSMVTYWLIKEGREGNFVLVLKTMREWDHWRKIESGCGKKTIQIQRDIEITYSDPFSSYMRIMKFKWQKEGYLICDKHCVQLFAHYLFFDLQEPSKIGDVILIFQRRKIMT